ncbi:MAG TPA: dTDP-4-amino-4,6-dideoxygalactose transaminase, partial [Acidobacteria bacterium]|nr:dTDP-4-amino-4,6-dideoxygalactose transaminase [Acidobacteriota bacterium]
PTPELRDGLIAHLKSREIMAVFHYVPLHASPMGRRVGCQDVELPVTEDVAARILRLPCYYGLEEDDQERITAAIQTFLTGATDAVP